MPLSTLMMIIAVVYVVGAVVTLGIILCIAYFNIWFYRFHLQDELTSDTLLWPLTMIMLLLSGLCLLYENTVIRLANFVENKGNERYMIKLPKEKQQCNTMEKR